MRLHSLLIDSRITSNGSDACRIDPSPKVAARSAAGASARVVLWGNCMHLPHRTTRADAPAADLAATFGDGSIRHASLPLEVILLSMSRECKRIVRPVRAH